MVTNKSACFSSKVDILSSQSASQQIGKSASQQIGKVANAVLVISIFGIT